MAKPKRLPLAERKRCHKGHALTKDNVYHYKGGTWCKRCRRASRLRSIARAEQAA